tara:strand:+ start:1002 stop:1439 length:438 start_codon:yes stop_codon:yes gene_type:complete
MTQRFKLKPCFGDDDFSTMFVRSIACRVIAIKQSMRQWEKTKIDVHLSDCLTSDPDAELCIVMEGLNLFLENIKPFITRHYERTGDMNMERAEIFLLKSVIWNWDESSSLCSLTVTPEMIMKYVRYVECIVDTVFVANIVYIVPL